MHDGLLAPKMALKIADPKHQLKTYKVYRWELRKASNRLDTCVADKDGCTLSGYQLLRSLFGKTAWVRSAHCQQAGIANVQQTHSAIKSKISLITTPALIPMHVCCTECLLSV